MPSNVWNGMPRWWHSKKQWWTTKKAAKKEFGRKLKLKHKNDFVSSQWFFGEERFGSGARGVTFK